MGFESVAVPERNPFRDDETGQYTEGYTPEDARIALEALGGAATTSEIAEELGCARRTAYNKLMELEESGGAQSRKSGRTRLWLLSEDDNGD